jgi:hypothetical protein
MSEIQTNTLPMPFYVVAKILEPGDIIRYLGGEYRVTKITDTRVLLQRENPNGSPSDGFLRIGINSHEKLLWVDNIKERKKRKMEAKRRNH